MSPAGLVLFDVDGTLLRPGCTLQRRHMDAMAGAIAEKCGVAHHFAYAGGSLCYGSIDLSGFTDAGTIEAALLLQGLAPDAVDELIPGVVEAMVRRADAHESTVDCSAELLPGVAQLVPHLAESGLAVGLSTGNARAIAGWKMRQTGLAQLLRDGGFGDSARRRPQVVAEGIVAFLGDRPLPGVLVGDTPSDVRSAHHNGLACLAVATGAATAGELRAAGADAVASDLADRKSILELITRLLSQTREEQWRSHASALS